MYFQSITCTTQQPATLVLLVSMLFQLKHTHTQHLPSRYFEPAFLRLLNWLYRYRIARQFTTTRRNVSDFCSIAGKYMYKQNISHTLTTVVLFKHTCTLITPTSKALLRDVKNTWFFFKSPVIDECAEYNISNCDLLS